MSWWTCVEWTECWSFAVDDICGVLGVQAGGICAEETYCSAAYWAECERHRGGAANANERETGDLLPSAVSLHYTARGLGENGGDR